MQSSRGLANHHGEQQSSLRMAVLVEKQFSAGVCEQAVPGESGTNE